MDLIASILFYVGYALIAWQMVLYVWAIFYIVKHPRAKVIVTFVPGLIGLSLLIMSYVIQGIMIATV